MSHTVVYKLEISDTDSVLGNTQAVSLPPDTETSFTSTYKQSFDLDIANATTDQSIDLGSITTVTGIYLYSDGEVTMEIGGEDITVTANKPLFWLSSSFTTLKVSNASGATVALKGTIWGD